MKKVQKKGKKLKKSEESGLETTKHGQKERNHPVLLMAKSRFVCCQKKKALQGLASVLREFPIQKDEIEEERQIRGWRRRQKSEVLSRQIAKKRIRDEKILLCLAIKMAGGQCLSAILESI